MGREPRPIVLPKGSGRSRFAGYLVFYWAQFTGFPLCSQAGKIVDLRFKEEL